MDPTFPVIAISPGDSFLVIDEPIDRCSPRGWRNGYFDDLVVFDSDGLLWPIRASLPRPLRFYDRFRRSIQVEVEYDEPRAGARSEAVALLEALLDEDETDLYDQFVSHSRLKALFRSAASVPALIAVARTLGEDADVAMSGAESATPDSALEEGLDELLRSRGARYRKTRSRTTHSGPTVSYHVAVRSDLDLDLAVGIVLDQMEVRFNGCVLYVEEAAFMRRLGTNESSRADWRGACLDLVRGILRGPLRIETRRLGGRVLGGYLYRREGGRWHRCGGGGSVFMFLGSRHVNDYDDWLLTDQPAER